MMDGMADDLVTWLRAQLDDDARLAQSASPGPWTAVTDNGRKSGIGIVGQTSKRGTGEAIAVFAGEPRTRNTDAQHAARHDPARVLAEVDAKRRILDLMMPGRLVYPGAYGQAYRDVLRLLALPYSDRPGYRDEWKP